MDKPKNKSKEKPPKEKNPLNDAKKDFIIGILITFLGLILLIISLLGINLFPTIVNIILAIIILIAGIIWIFLRSQPQVPTTQPVGKPIQLQKVTAGTKNFEQLVKYVYNSLQRGQKEEVIKAASQKAGWNTEDIVKAIQKAKQYLDQKKTYEQLEKYIVTQKQKGKKEDEIKKELIKAGWKKEIIENYFVKKQERKK